MKITSPLHSDEARGTIFGDLTFFVRHGKQIARRQKKQKDVITPARTAQRAKFLLGLTLWQSMPDNEKNYWKLISTQGYADI